MLQLRLCELLFSRYFPRSFGFGFCRSITFRTLCSGRQHIAIVNSGSYVYVNLSSSLLQQ